MTYRKSDSGSFMKTYRTGGAGSGSGATKKEKVETEEIYKILRNPTNAKLVKLVKVPKKSMQLPELENKAYKKVVEMLQKEILRLAKLQNDRDIDDPKHTAFGGDNVSALIDWDKDLYNKLSPQHAQIIIKSADRLYDIYATLSDTDWEDIMDDVGITSKKKSGVTYTYAQLKEEAIEIIQKFVDNKSYDSQLALGDFEFKKFLDQELKERRNLLANSFGSVDMSSQYRESGVIRTEALKVTNATKELRATSAFLRDNVGLQNNTDTGAREIIDFITELYKAVVRQVPTYKRNNSDVDFDIYQDGGKKKAKSKSIRAANNMKTAAKKAAAKKAAAKKAVAKFRKSMSNARKSMPKARHAFRSRR